MGPDLSCGMAPLHIKHSQEVRKQFCVNAKPSITATTKKMFELQVLQFFDRKTFLMRGFLQNVLNALLEYVLIRLS